MDEDVKKLLDEFVANYGTGVMRRGPKGKKEWTSININTSVKLSEILVKNANRLINLALKNARTSFSYETKRKMEEVFYDKMYEIMADYEPERYEPERQMTFSNYFIQRMGKAFFDELRKEPPVVEKIALDNDDVDAASDFPYTENAIGEAESAEIILQFCSLLFMTLKGVTPGKSRMYRMFFTEQYIIFCEEFEKFTVEQIRHGRELWDNLDKILLSCIYCKDPQAVQDLIITEHKNRTMLREYYGPYDDDNTTLQNGYIKIFEGCRNPDEKIETPLESRIFIASDYIRQHDVEGISEPKALSNAYITQSKKGKFNSDSSLKSPGFMQIKEEISEKLGLVR